MSTKITDIKSADGTLYASVQAAVDHFRCPGPCEPDCPLYPLVRLENGNMGHMCHKDIVRRFPTSVLDAMGYSYGLHVSNDTGETPTTGGTMSTGTPTEESRYIGVIRSGATRDAQIAKTANAGPLDDDAWMDVEDAEIYLGIFVGPEAKERAAEFGGTVPENIRLIPIDDGKGSGARNG